MTLYADGTAARICPPLIKASQEETTYGYGNRAADHEEGLPAVTAILFCSLFHLLSRPREYRACVADDEKRSRIEPIRVWVGRRGVLLGLFPPRGAEQPDPR